MHPTPNERQPEFTHVTKRIKGVTSAIKHQQKDAAVLSLVSPQSMTDLAGLLEVGDEEGRPAAAATIAEIAPRAPEPEHRVIFLPSPTRLLRRPLSQRPARPEEVTFEDEPTLLRLMTARLGSSAAALPHEDLTTAAAGALPLSPPLLPRCVVASERRRCRFGDAYS